MLSKLKNLFFGTLLLALLINTTAVFAAPETGVKGLLKRSATSAGYNPATNEYSLAGIVGSVIQVFLSLIGVIFISYTVFGGYLWMTAGGNEEKVTKAKDIIRNGIIGMIVVFAAAAIYLFVVTIFGINEQSGPTGSPL